MIERIKNIIAYAIVGFSGTLVEWSLYYLLSQILSVYYLIATVLSVGIATFANWLLGRLIAFKKAPKQNVKVEIAKIYIISIGGIILNTLLMVLLHDLFSVPSMLSKMIASFLVFFYNYSIRAFVLYKMKKVLDKSEK